MNALSSVNHYRAFFLVYPKNDPYPLLYDLKDQAPAFPKPNFFQKDPTLIDFYFKENPEFHMALQCQVQVLLEFWFKNRLHFHPS